MGKENNVFKMDKKYKLRGSRYIIDDQEISGISKPQQAKFLIPEAKKDVYGRYVTDVAAQQSNGYIKRNIIAYITQKHVCFYLPVEHLFTLYVF